MNMVLLTATVTPNVSEHLVVSDPHVRLRHYQDSVKEWHRALAPSGFDIAIVETSGATRGDILSKLSGPEQSNIAFFNYQPSLHQIERGKGAIEMAAIQHAITEHGGLAPESTIYKCTGRLPLINVNDCIGALSPMSVRARMTLDRSWVDTRLFGATMQVWKDLLFDSADRVDDNRGIYFERVVAARFSAGIALNEIRLSRFASRPLFSGVSGTSGNRYSPARSRLKSIVLGSFETGLARLATRKQV